MATGVMSGAEARQKIATMARIVATVISPEEPEQRYRNRKFLIAVGVTSAA